MLVSPRNLRSLLVVALCVASFASVAQAGVIFEWQSSYEANCSAIALNDGDAVSGTIEFDAPDVVADAFRA